MVSVVVVVRQAGVSSTMIWQLYGVALQPSPTSIGATRWTLPLACPPRHSAIMDRCLGSYGTRFTWMKRMICVPRIHAPFALPSFSLRL